MAKDFNRFNKFNETYDMYADGIEEEVVKFLKNQYPDAYKKAIEEAKQEESDFPVEERVTPSMIWGYVEDDDEFFSSLENWFKETYPNS